MENAIEENRSENGTIFEILMKSLLRFAPVFLTIAPAFEQGAASKPASLPAARPYADITKLAKPEPGSARIYIIRHAESVGNATRDDPKLTDEQKDKLTEKGEKQAGALGEALRSLAPKKLLHSPAKRAAQTAEMIKKNANVSAVPAESKDFGPIEPGKSPDAQKRAISILLDSWKIGADKKLDGGESLGDVCNRVKRGFINLIKENPAGEPIFVVTHGEVAVCIVSELEVKSAMAAMHSISVGNASILALDVSKDGASKLSGYFAPGK